MQYQEYRILMASGFIGQFTGLVIHPKSTFAALKEKSLRSAFAYFLAVWAISAVLLSTIGWRLNFHAEPSDSWLMAQFAVLVLICWLYFGLVVHAMLRILSGPKSLEKTIRAVLYAITPIAVIGWISIIGGLSFIWGLFLMQWGLMEYHGITNSRAFVVLLLSVMIGIFSFFIAYYFLLILTALI